MFEGKPVLLHPVLNKMGVCSQFERACAIARIVKVMLLTVGVSTRAFQNFSELFVRNPVTEKKRHLVEIHPLLLQLNVGEQQSYSERTQL